ncbi:MAG: trehalose utilization protein ThuA, partial [Pseudarthrobacter sp.]|nr:trehalose utilization protein ThuA [Pseudarthrobacter sp.]
MDGKLRIRVWNEGRHEAINEPPHIGEIYPDGIHGAIAAGLRSHYPEADITTAVLADEEHGLAEEVLAETDVLLWWGHMAHAEVSDAVVERVHRHVLGGMGLIVLHSGHFAKIFTKLLGTSCSLAWRNEGERELVWTVKPSHPIAEGEDSPIVIPE